MHRLVPQFILENYQVENYHGNFQAVCLLADVSGFSTMTDVLAQHGLHGSEVLANGMRRVFDPMIQSVMEYGGYVVGFAGDAITAIFPVTDTIQAAYSHAIAAAHGIQTHRTPNAIFNTPYGPFNISVKIGLGAGEARWRIVVSADSKRATYYFHGSAVDVAVTSLSLSESGQIVLCPVSIETLGDAIRGRHVGKHFLLEDYPESLPEPAPIPVLAPDPDHLRVFCSDEVSAHDLTGEFRPAVNLFIGTQLDSDREIYLEAFLQKVFSLQDRYGGLFSRVDVGDKGTNLLMFWGAPLAWENDVERALSFLLELLKGTGFPMKAGITYRLAYAGYIGGSLQEEYTCYGWGVNLSARLMMAAGSGEIWTDEEIARRAGQRFTFQHAGQQKLKGFAQEQNVFKLLKRKEDDRAVFSGEFIGRATELETLGRFIRPIWGGRFAGMLTVTGEPGIGKSRLVDAFQSSNLFTDHIAQWGVCQTDEIVRQSLNPFRYWLKRYFNLSDSMDEAHSKQAFDTKLDEIIAATPDHELSQTLMRTRSFLGELVDLHWADSLYEKMDAQGRFDNTFIALSALLRGESLKQPLVLLIEDAHLLDSDTKAFLSYLERSLTAEVQKNYPIALLATSRADGREIIFENAPNETISLRDLSGPDISHLAENLLGGPVSPGLIKILEQRAEGNPFFIEQITRYLQEEDKLTQTARGWQIAGEQALETLPTDISAILIARLDRLNRDVREVVQTASVLGREFEIRLLSKMLLDDAALPDKVHLAIEADVLSLLTEIRYIFRHALFRDAAYNMQLRARQQELHRIAVEALETLYQDQLAPHYSEIAYHADRAGLRDKAKSFYILAGAEAAQAYKNSLAIESYTRALALSSIETMQERIELLLARVALYRITGDRVGQEQDLATLELLADKQRNGRYRAIVALRQASFTFDIGEFQEAQRFAESAIEIAESAHAPDVAADAYAILPIALARQGQNKLAMQVGQTGLRLAQIVGKRESEGRTLNQLGLIALELNEPDRARGFFEKSLVIAQETGSRRLEAQVLNNMGNISGTIENDYSAARIFFARTLEIVREIGDRNGEGHALGNLGWAASMTGDFEKAHSYVLQRLNVARESGNRYLETYGLINLGAMMITQENYSESLTYIEQSLTLARKLKDRSAEAWALTFLGFASLGLGNLSDAKDQFQTAYEIRQSLDHKNLSMEALAGLAEVNMRNDDLAAALAYSERILSHLATGGSLDGTEEPLRIYLTVYLTLMRNDDSRADDVLEESYSVLQKQITKIQEESIRDRFVQNVPWRRQINELWAQNRSNREQGD